MSLTITTKFPGIVIVEAMISVGLLDDLYGKSGLETSRRGL